MPQKYAKKSNLHNTKCRKKDVFKKYFHILLY